MKHISTERNRRVWEIFLDLDVTASKVRLNPPQQESYQAELPPVRTVVGF